MFMDKSFVSKALISEEQQQMKQAQLIANKSATDVSHFWNYVFNDSDNVHNSVLKKILTDIVNDFMNWRNLHFPVPYLNAQMWGYLNGALYSLYPQQNVKYLDKASTGKNPMKWYKIWLNKLGTTDYTGTDIDYLQDDVQKLKDFAYVCSKQSIEDN